MCVCVNYNLQVSMGPTLWENSWRNRGLKRMLVPFFRSPTKFRRWDPLDLLHAKNALLNQAHATFSLNLSPKRLSLTDGLNAPIMGSTRSKLGGPLTERPGLCPPRPHNHRWGPHGDIGAPVGDV